MADLDAKKMMADLEKKIATSNNPVATFDAATKSRNTDSFDTKLKRQKAGITDPKTGKYTGMFDKIATSKNLERMGKVARASTYGKIALGVVGAGLAAKEYLKSKMKKKESPDDEMNEKPESKMGGGMMKYNKGSMVVARGNKLARSKPTKMC
jgi:hypothetical protein